MNSNITTITTASTVSLTSLSSIKNGSGLVFENGSSLVNENGSSLAPMGLTEDDNNVGGKMSSICDIFDGKWVRDDSDPIYDPGSCPFLDYAFNCFENGRLDLGYLRYRWQPNECDIPRSVSSFFVFLFT